MPDYVVPAGQRIVIEHKIREGGETVSLDQEHGNSLVERGLMEPVSTRQSKHSERKPFASGKDESEG